MTLYNEITNVDVPLSTPIAAANDRLIAIGTPLDSNYHIVSAISKLGVQPFDVVESRGTPGDTQSIDVDENNTFISVLTDNATIEVDKAELSGNTDRVISISVSDSDPNEVSLSDDGSKLAFVGTFGDLIVYETSNFTEIVNTSLSNTGIPSTPAFSPSGEELAVARGEELFIYDVSTGQVVNTVTLSNNGYSGDSYWTNDNKILVGATDSITGNVGGFSVVDRSAASEITFKQTFGGITNNISRTQTEDVLLLSGDSYLAFFDTNKLELFERRYSVRFRINAEYVPPQNAFIRGGFSNSNEVKAFDGLERVQLSTSQTDPQLFPPEDVRFGELRSHFGGTTYKGVLTDPQNTRSNVRVQSDGSAQSTQFSLEQQTERLIVDNAVRPSNYNKERFTPDSKPDLVRITADWNILTANIGDDVVSLYDFNGNKIWSNSVPSPTDISLTDQKAFVTEGDSANLQEIDLASGSTTSYSITEPASKIGYDKSESIAYLTETTTANDSVPVDQYDLSSESTVGTATSSFAFDSATVTTIQFSNAENRMYNTFEDDASAEYELAKYNPSDDSFDRKVVSGNAKSMAIDNNNIYIGSSSPSRVYKHNKSDLSVTQGPEVSDTKNISVTPYGRIFTQSGEILSTDTLDVIDTYDEATNTSKTAWPRYGQFPDYWQL